MNYQFCLEQGTCVIKIEGSLNVYQVGQLWLQLDKHLKDWRPKRLQVDLGKIDYLDGAGVSFLHHCQRQIELCELINIKAPHKKLIELYGPSSSETLKKEQNIFSNLPNFIGRLTYGIFDRLSIQVAFIGETVYEFLQIILNPKRLRWKDTLKVANDIGVNGVGIICLIGFLLGLILAFQAAIPMRQFGVEIFVANLVGLSLIRELGPLITCVILAGRSGSAFAAEIGTMKVNEELSALETMGLSPVRFLVIPKMLAMFFVTPFLTIFFNFLGLIGGCVVLMSMGYPIVAFTNQVIKSVSIGDAFGGLFKSLVFALLVAGVGCYQGLHTGSGAQSVGTSTTRAVVIGIIMIAVTDGAFAVAFFALGI